MAFVKLQKRLYKTSYILCLKRKISFPCKEKAVYINTSSQKASVCLGVFTVGQEGTWTSGHLEPFAGAMAVSLSVSTDSGERC